jgi:predicted nuclease of predicted toxin-antitoxin system
VRFKVDENLPIEVAELLSSAGHDALTVFDQSLIGAEDRKILKVCQGEQRILITMDLDFSDVRSYLPGEYNGIIVLRLHRQDKPHVLRIIQQTIPVFEQEQIEQRLWIVEEGRIRIRGEDN